MAMSDLLGLHVPRGKKVQISRRQIARKLVWGEWIGSTRSENVITSEMGSNSPFEQLISDTINQNQGTQDRFMEDVLLSRVSKRDMVANQCRHNGWAVPWGYPVLAFVRPEPDVSEK